MPRRPKYPGYHADRLPSGNIRHRVRVEGDPKKWIRILAGPDDPLFRQQYFDARAGVATKQPDEPTEAPTRTFAWLVRQYQLYLKKQHELGKMAPATFKKANLYLNRMSNALGTRPVVLKEATLVQVMDTLADRPNAANRTMVRVAQMYDWAIKRGKVPEGTVNPAASIEKIEEDGTGAIPWSLEDIETYCKKHKAGSTARLMLSLHVGTGCRISDSVWLGHDQERWIQVPQEGWALQWETRKTGTPCSVPMSELLYEATRPFSRPGLPYITRSNGQPYASADALGQAFRKWCREAGLENRSSHGLRKMVAANAASNGADAFGIAALLGQTSLQTTEIYTRTFNRQLAAASTVAKLSVHV
ncbi:MAG: tyrosine-type recombinase/integrase [Pseudomonadota bacterium]